MFEFRDLFQWDRFITPTIIKTFYWLVIALIGLFGIAGIFSGLAAMAISPFGGFIQLLSSIASVVVESSPPLTSTTARFESWVMPLPNYWFSLRKLSRCLSGCKSQTRGA